ncbi:MAG: arsenic resistance N-acetyltransferase ArsN2 [Bacteroidota bacterium]
MRYSIRRAGPADAPSVKALLAAHRLPSDGIRPHLDTFLVAHAANGDLLGSAGLELYPDSALLRSVAVQEPHHGAGIGGQLTEAALHLARHRGILEVYLLTETAADFFPRHGFAPVGRSTVPASIRQTEAFTTLCSTQAVVMHCAL